MSLPEDIHVEILKNLPLLTYVKTVNFNSALMRLASRRVPEHGNMMEKYEMYKQLHSSCPKTMLELAMNENDVDVFRLGIGYKEKPNISLSDFTNYHMNRGNYSVIADIVKYSGHTGWFFYNAVLLTKLDVFEFLLDNHFTELSLESLYSLDIDEDKEFVKLYLNHISYTDAIAAAGKNQELIQLIRGCYQ